MCVVCGKSFFSSFPSVAAAGVVLGASVGAGADPALTF